jgi:hypothetical protein
MLPRGEDAEKVQVSCCFTDGYRLPVCKDFLPAGRNSPSDYTLSCIVATSVSALCIVNIFIRGKKTYD